MNKKHKYYTQIKSQMVLAKSEQGYLVLRTTKDIFVGKINTDLIYWSKVSINLDVFFRKYVMKALLGIQPLTLCRKNSKSWWKRKKLVKMNTISRAFAVTDAACDISLQVGTLGEKLFCSLCLTNISGLE